MPLSLDHDSGAAEMEDIFSIEDFLAAEQAKDLVRFSTAGSVDDGKSTLIGRLLFDTHSVADGKVERLQAAAKAEGLRLIDGMRLGDELAIIAAESAEALFRARQSAWG